ncbi:hypothetical protein HWQ46_05060 [Shewanella sp. D64]|uniref:hypothetical protein n=1 Tax=unclassified Shewanella TaxID=196818 RepID=UPI0022BA707B|nr:MULTISPECIES: hypothetical protein [unclassified Shewanella]MEC4724920.1 hypothetical protein [Shewanella sp. D64]MEC4736287.1 hypothetical protein [Shewanella sp. E94]WBJ97649.1 hypothetical protein HWQ47_11430 [Shewanella sp. MTB7]
MQQEQSHASQNDNSALSQAFDNGGSNLKYGGGFLMLAKTITLPCLKFSMTDAVTLNTVEVFYAS